MFRVRPRSIWFLIIGALLGVACDGGSGTGNPDASPDAAPVGDAIPLGDAAPDASLDPFPIQVLITLDGVPVVGAIVSQGGNPDRWLTDLQGRATVVIDPGVDGELVIIAAHPEARTGGDFVPADRTQEVQIDLIRFDPVDNPLYTFLDPGEPTRRDFPDECSHCHVSGGEFWYASAHRTSASNPTLQDLYAGAVSSATDPGACAAVGGQWLPGPEPGSTSTVDRCFLGGGVVETLNLQCGPGVSCTSPPTEFGACADCHAPGIDGALGGRDLLEATGFAYDYGVHCDVCHKVESVDPSAPAGVAGRLRILRPSEPSFNPFFGVWVPLYFGHRDDVPNPFMGAVPRAHFRTSEFCSGCHQLDQSVLVPGQAVDPVRWPTGLLPIHSTYAEWVASPMNPGATCQVCHMPPDLIAANSIDLGTEPSHLPGFSDGWARPPGDVRQHSFTGPRDPNGTLLVGAALLQLTTQLQGNELTVGATVTNVGAGHAIPTGEPMRSMVLLIEARCGGQVQPVIGGDAVPDFAGYLARQDATGDWSLWPGAEVGQVVRVVGTVGLFHDYPGFGPFGDGTFTPAEKGMPVEEALGGARITDMQGDVATFDRPLPAGDVAYLGEEPGLPLEGDPVRPRAGAAGFAFARVLVGPGGERMVPHYLAVDVASDNRLPPMAAWTSSHRFDVSCAAPEVEAVLVHRAYPYGLAAQRGWDAQSRIMLRQTTP